MSVFRRISLMRLISLLLTSALAAVVATRCALTCVFNIVGFQLYRRLDYAW